MLVVLLQVVVLHLMETIVCSPQLPALVAVGQGKLVALVAVVAGKMILVRQVQQAQPIKVTQVVAVVLVMEVIKVILLAVVEVRAQSAVMLLVGLLVMAAQA